MSQTPLGLRAAPPCAITGYSGTGAGECMLVGPPPQHTHLLCSLNATMNLVRSGPGLAGTIACDGWAPPEAAARSDWALSALFCRAISFELADLFSSASSSEADSVAKSRWMSWAKANSKEAAQKGCNEQGTDSLPHRVCRLGFGWHQTTRRQGTCTSCQYNASPGRHQALEHWAEVKSSDYYSDKCSTTGEQAKDTNPTESEVAEPSEHCVPWLLPRLCDIAERAPGCLSPLRFLKPLSSEDLKRRLALEQCTFLVALHRKLLCRLRLGVARTLGSSDRVLHLRRGFEARPGFLVDEASGEV